MGEVGVRELKERTSEVLRRVCEANETVLITRRGKVIAKLVPEISNEDEQAELRQIWADIDELAKEIGAVWPKGVSAVEAVREQRRDL